MTQLLTRRDVLSLGAAALATPLSAGSALQSDSFLSDATGTFVGSTEIMGDSRAVLVDAQLDRGNANALADLIAATGRQLQTIVITHLHPDHIMGLDILLRRFPEAPPVAHPVLQPMLAQVCPSLFAALKSQMGPVLADRFVTPDPMAGDTIDLEGARVTVLPPMHDDTPMITPVYIEDLDTLITSDIALADTHVYVAENTTAEALEAWRASLRTLEAINAGTIIPGHRLTDASAAPLLHTARYLDAWEAAYPG